MDYLRLILLFAGLALIAGIYVWGKGKRSRQAQRKLFERDDDIDLGELPSFESETGESADEILGLKPLQREIAIELDEPELPIDEPTLTIEPEVESADEPAPQQKQQKPEPIDPGLGRQEVDRVVALYIVAPRDLPFEGPALLAAFDAVGLEHGAMRIYHHRVEGGGVFSLANLVEPGHFEPEQMDDTFTTPGLTLFMPLPGGGDALKTLDAMLELAHGLADRLGGELRDESKSVLSRQTASHMREEVQEYLRKRQLEQRKSSKP